MTIDRSDIDAAVKAGVLSEEAGARFAAFLDRREAGGGYADSENVRFARGFHDIFITIGVICLMSAIAMGGSIFAGGLFWSAIALAVAWGLAEFLTGVRRLVLPSIALAIAVPVAAGFLALFGVDSMVADPDPGLAPVVAAGASLAAALGFWLRFRLPFALATVVAGALYFAVAIIDGVMQSWLEEHMAATLLICGLITFAVAMWQDLSDPQRATLRADNAFWLHLMAAPLIVHSLLGLVMGGISGIESAQDAVFVLLILSALSLVALIIDRRAMLVAGLTTFGVAVAQLVNVANPDYGGAFAITLGILGVAVLLLGTGWRAARRVLLGAVPAGLSRRLPPVTV